MAHESNSWPFHRFFNQVVTGWNSRSASGALPVWSAGHVILTQLDLSPSPTEWPPEEIATDSWHHLAYAIATGSAYDRLQPRGR